MIIIAYIITEENNYLQKIEKILRRLLETNLGINIAIVTSMEGLPIFSILPQKHNESKISAMVAAMLSLSEISLKEMDIGEFNQIFIKGIDGVLIVFDANPAVLAVSATNDVKLGLVFLECDRAAKEISEILKNR